MPAVAEPAKVSPAPAPPTPAAPQPSATPMSEPPAKLPEPPPPDQDPFAAQDAEIAAKFKAFEDKTNPPPASQQKPEVKKEEPKPQAKVEPEKQKPVFKEPKELRAELDRRGQEIEKMKGQLSDYSKMESKLKELETKGQDTSKLVERMSSLEGEIKSRDAVIRRLKKEESPEFKRDFRQPLDDAAEEAASVFNTLAVTQTNGEGETTTRQANWSRDFSSLFSMDIATARRTAKQMFPEDYDTVMGFYTDLHGKKRAMDRALKREQEQAQELDKQEEATRLQREEQMKTIKEKVFKEIGESVEDYRDPADDKEVAEARAKGFQLFDFQPRTFEEYAKKEAHVRHRFAAYGPLKLQVARLKQQLSELTKERDELKEPPTPGKTRKPSGDGGEKVEKPWEQDFLEHVKNA